MSSLVEMFLQEPSDSASKALLGAAMSGTLADGEIARLASGMAGSGPRLEIDDRAADLASTGGPSSLSTLVSPLFLRVAGYLVPKLGVSGRPAGGVDILRTIPGFNASLSLSAVREAVNASGYVHVEAGGIWAPLDAHLFHFRQRFGGQQQPSLVIASILSKKLAMGVMSAGLEIRVSPHGNFGASFEEARTNARRYVRVGKLLGLNPRCVITDGTSPYQPFIGRGEALIALQNIFEDSTSPWLKSHLELCAEMARAVLSDAPAIPVSHSDLAAVHGHLLETHGSSFDRFLERADGVREQDRDEVVADREGWPAYDLAAIRNLLVARQREEEAGSDFVSDPAGFTAIARPNRLVSKGELMALIRVPTGESDLSNSLAHCVQVKVDSGPAPVGATEVIDA